MMKIKNVKLEWYAFYYDWNEHEIKFTNVLSGMEEEIAKKIRKGAKDKWEPVTDYNSFKKYIRSELMYHYWCKSEYEVVIYDLFDTNDERGEKHDVFWQLEPNLDRVCEYIINKMNIVFDKK